MAVRTARKISDPVATTGSIIATAAAVRHALEEGTIYETEFEAELVVDGTAQVRWYSLSVRRAGETAGVVEAIAVLSDVTRLKAREHEFQTVAHEDAGGGAIFAVDDAQRVIGTEEHGVPAVELERNRPVAAAAVAGHLRCPERRRVNVDLELLDGSDQHMAAVGLASQHGREQADHCRPTDRTALVIPGAVPGDAHAGMAAALGVPLVDGRQPALVDKRLELGEAQSLELDRRAGLRHRAPVVIGAEAKQ